MFVITFPKERQRGNLTLKRQWSPALVCPAVSTTLPNAHESISDCVNFFRRDGAK